MSTSKNEVKALKINGPQINRIVNLYKTHEQEVKKEKHKSPVQGQDQVILSEEAKLLQATKVDGQKIEKFIEERAQRVDEVKILIEKGKYHVDARQVAEKMVDGVLYNKKV